MTVYWATIYTFVVCFRQKAILPTGLIFLRIFKSRLLGCKLRSRRMNGVLAVPWDVSLFANFPWIIDGWLFGTEGRDKGRLGLIHFWLAYLFRPCLHVFEHLVIVYVNFHLGLKRLSCAALQLTARVQIDMRAWYERHCILISFKGHWSLVVSTLCHLFSVVQTTLCQRLQHRV